MIHATAALAGWPAESPLRWQCIHALAGMRWERYELDGHLDDLDAAIAMTREVLTQVTEAVHRRSLSNNLGLALWTRFELCGAACDINEAVHMLRLASRGGGRFPERRLLWWNNLANALQSRFAMTREQPDLRRAVALHRLVLRATPPNSPDLAIHRANLANTLRRLHGVAPSRVDLGEADDLARAAAADSSAPLIDRAACLMGLAASLQDEADSTATPGDWDRAVSAFRAVIAAAGNARPRITLRMAIHWGDRAFLREAWEESIEAYGHAARAREHVVAAQLTREAKEAWILNTQGAAARAAYSAAMLHSADEAVTLLEAGLAQLVGETLERNRADLEHLSTLGRDDLFARYRSASSRLVKESGLSTPEQSAADHRLVTDNAYAARSILDDVITEIRSVPGYEGFLMRPTLAEIVSAAVDAPIVYITVTEKGGLALIVKPGKTPVTALFLPDATEQWLSLTLSVYLEAYRRQSDPSMHQHWLDTLAGTTRILWDLILAPIVDELKAEIAATLIPVGQLTLLPLHAAWREAPDAPTQRRYAFDDLLLTYAPSARVLGHRRPGSFAPGDRAVMIDSGTASHVPLAGIALERHAMTACFPDVITLCGSAANRRNVLDALESSTIVHFGCHGRANLLKPLDSALELAGGESLSLRDLLTLRLRAAQWAILCACETGMPGVHLPDEIVSLPSGMLQAGFSGIASTLWAVPDLPIAVLMSRFYEIHATQRAHPAEALRRAQQWLRDLTNEEMVQYLTLLPTRLLPDRVFQVIRTRAIEAPSQRSWADPCYWAALTWTGSVDTSSSIAIQEVRCGTVG